MKSAKETGTISPDDAEGVLSIQGASHAPGEETTRVRGLSAPQERPAGQPAAENAVNTAHDESGVSIPWRDTTESRRSLLRASADAAARRFHGVAVGEDAEGLHYTFPDNSNVRHEFVDRIAADTDELPAYFQSAIAANDGLQYFTEDGVDYKIPKTVEEWNAMRPAERAAVLDNFRLHGKYDRTLDRIYTTHRALHDHTIIAEEVFHAMAERLRRANPELYDKMVSESTGKKGSKRYIGEDQAFHDYLRGRKLGSHAFKWMKRGTALPRPLTGPERAARNELALARRKGNAAPETPTAKQAAGERLLQAAQERGYIVSDYEFEALLDNDAGIDPDYLDQFTTRDARGKADLVPPAERVENGGRNNWRNWKLTAEGRKLKAYVSEDNAIDERDANRIAEYLTTSRAEKYEQAAKFFHDEHEDPALQKDAEEILGTPVEKTAAPEPSPDEAHPEGEGELPQAQDDVPFAARRKERDETNTPEFKQWFGESKVVDDKGAPRVVYHGTNREFDKFSRAKAGVADRHDPGLVGKAFYFTDSGEQSGQFALGAQFRDVQEGRAKEEAGAAVMPVYLSMKNPYIVADGKLPDGRSITDIHQRGISKESGTQWQKEIKAAGHDGVIFTLGGEASQFVVFREGQIKSALGNRGTFNPNDPRIQYATRRKGEDGARDEGRPAFSLSAPDTQGGLDFTHRDVEQARDREETKFEASAIEDVKPAPSLDMKKRLGVTDKNLADARQFTDNPTPAYARGVKTALLGRDLDVKGLSEKEATDAQTGFADASAKMTEKQKDLALAIRRHENPTEDKTYSRIAKKFRGGEDASGAMFAARKKTEADRERDLAAMHNIDAAGLHGADELGGIPHPSIAITKTGIPFHAYGDITLIGDRAMIDPANRENQVFDADAWSPRMPERQWKVDAATLKKVAGELRADPVVKKYSQPGDWTDSLHYIESWLDQGHRQWEEAISQSRRSLPMLAKFASDNGLSLPRFKVVAGDEGRAIAERARDKLRTSIRAAGLQETFEKWTEDLFNSAKGESFFKNRRGVKKPWVLDEIENDMRRQRVAGAESTAMKSLGNAKAVGAKRFKSVDQIIGEAERLAPDKQAHEYHKVVQEQFFAAATAMESAWPYRETFAGKMDQLDATAEAMGAMLRSRSFSTDTADHMLHRAGYQGEIPAEALSQFVEVGKAMDIAPVEYFEAKPQRAVNLQDFRGALIPSDTLPETRALLARRGIPTAEYPRGEVAARQAALDKFARELDQKDGGVLFAVRKRDAQEPSDIPPKPEKPEDQDTRPDPTLFGAYDKGPTGIRNAITAIERETRHLPGAAEVVRRGYSDTVLVEARAEFNSNRAAGENLVARIEHDPSKPITDTDDAILTFHQVDLQNQFAANAAKLIEAKESGDDAGAEAARLESARLSDELLRTYNAGKKAGTANARGLAARRILMNEDYTYAGIETRLRAAKGGERLSDEESSRVKEMAAKIKLLQDQVDTFQKKHEAAMRRQKRDLQAKALEADVTANKPMTRPRDAVLMEKRAAIVSGIREKLLRLRGAKFAVRPEGEMPPPNIADRPGPEAAFDVSSVDGLASDLRALERTFVEGGMKDREARVKAVHAEIENVIPEMTERDVMDALSGYGKFKTPSADAVDKELRQGHAWMQAAGKLLDVLKNLAPKRSGLQRGEMDDATRRLQQQVREKMKELGIVTTDPATQLKTALQARKRALRNAVSDLEYQIAQRTKIVRQKTATPEDAETLDLTKRRDHLRQEFDDIFGKPSITPEQRAKAAVKSAEREAAELERRVKENDLYRQQNGLTETPEMKAARAKRDAAREELDNLRSADAGYQQGLKDKADADKIAALEAKISANADRVARGDIAAPKKESDPGSPEYQALVKQNDKLLDALDQMRKDAVQGPEVSPEFVALQARKAQMRRRMSELAEQLATKDFGPPEPKVPVTMDAEGQRLQSQLEAFKEAADRAEAQARYDAKPKWQKRLEAVPKWARMGVLSGYHILAKLQAAAMARSLITPIEEAVGAGLSKIPGLSKLAARAPRHGGASLQAEVLAITEGLVKHMPEAWAKLKTGKSAIDLLYGEKEWHPSSWMDFFGHLHGALKEPVRQMEWQRSFTKRQLAAAREGVNVADPAVMMKHGQEAYQDAQRAIFMQENIATKSYNAALAVLEARAQKGGAGAVTAKIIHTLLKSTFPIVHVPTNIVAETGEYVFGTAIGSVRAAKAFRAGIEKVAPVEADAIMRHLKKGTLGAAAVLLGYAGAQFLGGYDQKKKPGGDVAPGKARLFGVDVPKLLLHHPLFEALQIGATMSRVAHDYNRKTGEERGHTEGATAAMLGLLDEVPFVRGSADVAELVDPNQRDSYLQRKIASMLIPGVVQQLAEDTDAPTTGDVVKNMLLQGGTENRRRSDTLGDTLKARVPGLRQQLPQKDEAAATKQQILNLFRSGKQAEAEKLLTQHIKAGDLGGEDAGLLAKEGTFATDTDAKFGRATAKEAVDQLAAMSSLKRNNKIPGQAETYRQMAERKVESSMMAEGEKAKLRARLKAIR